VRRRKTGKRVQTVNKYLESYPETPKKPAQAMKIVEKGTLVGTQSRVVHHVEFGVLKKIRESVCTTI
jgi:hypothetical protein